MHSTECVQCVAVCCSVLQCVAVCCSVLQCVAVCCSVLQGCIPQSPLSCCEAPFVVTFAIWKMVCVEFVELTLLFETSDK